MQYPDLDTVIRALGGPRVVREPVHTMADLSRVVDRGLPMRSLHAVSARFPAELRQDIEYLVAPRTTLQRREREGILSAEESARLERLARISVLAEEVWEEPTAVQAFLTSPHPLLDGQTPLQASASELGARRVESLLWKLEHSLPV